MKTSMWGQVDGETRIVPGVTWVTTPSHGGMMVAAAVAKENLSFAACEGREWGSYYCFEEDCDWAIAYYERPEWWRTEYQERLRGECQRLLAGDKWITTCQQRAAMSDQEIRDYCMETIQTWGLEYLALAAKGLPWPEKTPGPTIGAEYRVHYPGNPRWDGLRVKVLRNKRKYAVCADLEHRIANTVQVRFSDLVPCNA